MVEAAAIILAGGKSSRMGRDKALVRVNQHGMLEDAVNKLAAAFPEIIIAANDESYSFLGHKMVSDIMPGHGPLSGIHAGLQASGYQNNFVVACDIPFVNVDLALYLVSLANGFDGVVPRMGEFFEPLFAVYSKSCLPTIERQLKTGKKRVSMFFSEVNIRYVEPPEIQRFGNPEWLFFNVNTGEDLEKARVIAREGS